VKDFLVNTLIFTLGVACTSASWRATLPRHVANQKLSLSGSDLCNGFPIMQDPTHPRFHEINRKYNRLVGLPE